MSNCDVRTIHLYSQIDDLIKQQLYNALCEEATDLRLVMFLGFHMHGYYTSSLFLIYQLKCYEICYEFYSNINDIIFDLLDALESN